MRFFCAQGRSRDQSRSTCRKPWEPVMPRAGGPGKIWRLNGPPDKEQVSTLQAAALNLRATFETAIASGLDDEQMWLLLEKAPDLLPPGTALDTAVDRLAADLGVLA